jgi:hypothetical protein
VQRTDKTMSLLEAPVQQGPSAVEHSAAPTANLHNSPRMVAQRRQLRSLFGAAAHLHETTSAPPNQTGLPDNLKSGVESLSGVSLDHVRVHYNSSEPAQLNALAYAQGGEIHVASGQEHHLPHEAWHVVQQAQGRVQATKQMNGGVPVNDDGALEHEADVMGARALQMQVQEGLGGASAVRAAPAPVQRQQAADRAGDGWAADWTVTWGKSEGKPVTIRVLARAFSNHFTQEWSGKIMASVQSMWDDIKKRRDDGTLHTLSWGQYVVPGKTTDISFSVDYDSRANEVVVKHAHAIQEGAHYPKQLKPDPTRGGRGAESGELTLEWSAGPVREAPHFSAAAEVAQAKRVDIGTVSVRYEEEGGRVVVYLPGGFPPGKKVDIIDKIGRSELIFKNEPSNEVVHAGGNPTANPDESTKVLLAKQLIKDYLNSEGVKQIGEDDVGALIEQAPVRFFQGLAWRQFLIAGNVFGSGLAQSESTEGAVDPRAPVGKREVGINQAYHTVPAIVHELVHTLEHATLPPNLAEGMTEWIALQATGLDERQTASGGTVYASETAIVKLALARGAVTNEALLRAYFFGELAGIERLEEAFRIFSNLSQQTFAYRGLKATVQDPLAELGKSEW